MALVLTRLYFSCLMKIGDQRNPEVVMTLLQVMWLVWGFLVVVFVLLKVYVSRLNRDESDQIVLDDVFAHVTTENDAILAKVGKIESYARIELWVLAAVSLGMIVYYIKDMMQQFQ